MIRVLAAVAAATVTLGLSGCSAISGRPSPSAEQVVQQLAGQVSAARPGVVFTAETDPNHLLGRPTGYLSKASWTDTRVPADELPGTGEGAVERGGTVEVFADEGGAVARRDYIQGLAAGMPALAEYAYVDGPMLVRVSRLLTPTQAAEYERALTSGNTG